ncbi:MAG: serine/threonine protein kinase [Kofleriaceae bacterium]|nr:serine/threonine protein kinase [Kofleriaceae bacterium]
MQGDDPDTLVKTRPSRQHLTTPAEGVDEETKALDGYVPGELIGQGGIGEVIAAHDLRIGRDVAVKRLKSRMPAADEVSRFMREARIQARLDHPTIPPVYDVGTDKEGRPYFTMKRLAGTTLVELLSAPEPNRPRLLRAFAEVCTAIDFAHSRGVVHRDLKPGNVMLGDYGDVYVLDWGLARVVGEAIAEVRTDDIDSLDIRSGDILGTPGYMAPEQLQRVGDTGRPADIYALGSILFEILAGEPLHPRGPTAIASTVGNEAVTSPAKRRSDRAVPPELDSVCTSMLAIDPSSRPTARKVAERVQAYLDGDRDVARRKTMAVDLVWTARASVNEGRRADAMRLAGRALALDPESAGAAEIVTTLMLEPPAEPPPELRDALRAADETGVRRHARTAVIAYLAIASFLPIAAWNGIKRWDIVLGVFGASILMAAAALLISLRPRRSMASMIGYALGNVILLALLSRMAGPFTFVPALACVVIMSSMAYPTFTERPAVLLVLIVVGFLVPIGLEHEGLLSMTWEIDGGKLISHAGALSLQGTPTLAMLIGASVATIAIAGIHAARIYRAGRDAQRRLLMQTWHLRQLLPH